ncbi:MAG: helix-turn-helix domain-containing protein [Clostridium sp.]|nr:helix-turn-helix domain-containing protein [Clostridium sp.]
MKYAFEEVLTGGEIRELRSKLEMNREEFAAFCGVSKKTVEHWENSGKSITGPITALAALLREHPEYGSYYEIPERKLPLRLFYMFRNRLCTIIDVDEQKRLVEIRNYTRDNIFRAFGANTEPTFEEYEEFLESRCFPRERDRMKIMLRELDLPFYDPFLIIRKTEGRMAEDEFWIRMEGRGV